MSVYVLRAALLPSLTPTCWYTLDVLCVLCLADYQNQHDAVRFICSVGSLSNRHDGYGTNMLLYDSLLMAGYGTNMLVYDSFVMAGNGINMLLYDSFVVAGYETNMSLYAVCVMSRQASKLAWGLSDQHAAVRYVCYLIGMADYQANTCCCTPCVLCA
eukprot:g82513.t1